MELVDIKKNISDYKIVEDQLRKDIHGYIKKFMDKYHIYAIDCGFDAIKSPFTIQDCIQYDMKELLQIIDLFVFMENKPLQFLKRRLMFRELEKLLEFCSDYQINLFSNKSNIFLDEILNGYRNHLIYDNVDMILKILPDQIKDFMDYINHDINVDLVLRNKCIIYIETNYEHLIDGKNFNLI